MDSKIQLSIEKQNRLNNLKQLRLTKQYYETLRDSAGLSSDERLACITKISSLETEISAIPESTVTSYYPVLVDNRILISLKTQL
jgi:nicotinic acid phosphoribosyltransferase